MNVYVYLALQALLPAILLNVNDLERHHKQYIVFTFFYQIFLGAMLSVLLNLD